MEFKNNPDYDLKSPNWTIYKDLFEGDKKTLANTYLIPHEFERANKGKTLLDTRKERTEYTNFIRPFIKRFASLIFKNDADYTDARSAIGEDEFHNIDGNGTSFDDFLKRQIAEHYFLYGKVIGFVDSFPIRAVSKLDEKAKGLRPYLELWEPLSVTDYQQSSTDKHTSAVDFATYHYEQIEPRTRATEEIKVNKYVKHVFLDNGIYTVEIYKGGSGQSYELDDVIVPTPALNFIPICVLETESWIKETAAKARQLYNLESVLDNIHLFQAHQRILAVGNFKAAEGSSIAASEGNLVVLNGEGSLTIAEPVDTLSLERRIDNVFSNMVKVTFNQMRQLPASSGSAESWQTIREAKEEFRELAVNAAKDLESFANNMIHAYLMYGGKKEQEFKQYVKLDTDITEEDINELILWVSTFRDRIDKYPTWRKEVDRTAAKRMNLPEIDKIIEEIDSAPEEKATASSALDEVFNGRRDQGAAETA